MKINICTWNLLNPDPKISYKSWIPYLDQKTALIFAKYDYKRYNNSRIYGILNIIKFMCKKSENPLIICLQEVNPKLVLKLQKNFSSNQLVINKETKRNYLVTIVTKTNIIKSDKIILDKKIAQITHINLQNQIICCANVHFYWKWSSDEVLQYGSDLIRHLEHPFIIAGDFNKPINMLSEFMDLFDCVLYNSINDGFTSHLTHLPNNKTSEINKSNVGIIDHIMFSSEFSFGEDTKYKIVNNINRYKIYYNFEKLIKMNENDLIEWSNKKTRNDISDHKAVFVKNINLLIK